jgi:hypothetical protein
MLGMNAGYLLLWPGLRGFGASNLPPVRLEVWGNPVPVLVFFILQHFAGGLNRVGGQTKPFVFQR